MSELAGVLRALVEALERGEKLSYTGHLVVTDPDSPSSVQMVLDEDDFAVLKSAAQMNQEQQPPNRGSTEA